MDTLVKCLVSPREAFTFPQRSFFTGEERRRARATSAADRTAASGAHLRGGDSGGKIGPRTKKAGKLVTVAGDRSRSDQDPRHPDMASPAADLERAAAGSSRRREATATKGRH
ncbi:hypothetical protein U9M48_010285 [Paspalum notatum var. saurae]|uniref:Uncharacterized protein n=1 Tax=Paspalum notatum var. saurae TaxID=547442 RepID=A0AAQ3WG05_PASNO